MKQIQIDFKVLTVLIIAFLLISMLIAPACKKEEKDNWQLCSNCAVELIVGTYSGKADHVKKIDSINYVTTQNKDAYLTITKTSSGIALQCGVVNLFSASFSGPYQNSYFITLSGFSSSLNCRVWRDGENVKIAGTAKKLDSSGDTSELLDFEVYKKLN